MSGSECGGAALSQPEWEAQQILEGLGFAAKKVQTTSEKSADYLRVANDIALYNFFLRPAVTGESLKCAPEDDDIANEAFAHHYADLRPTAVVFLSVLARTHFRAPEGVTVIATAHPSSPWWNRKSRTRGNKSGREILTDFVATTAWP